MLNTTKKSKLFGFALALVSLALTVSAIAFPFWLEGPKRDNKYDQKSGLYAWPTPYSTPTPLPTFTQTVLGTATNTPPPTATLTISPTFSVSPTNTPFAGSPTNTYTSTPTPSSTETPSANTLFEDHEVGSLVDPQNYGDTGSGSAVTGPTASTVEAYSGSYSTHINVTSAGWGAGANWQSNYLVGGMGGYLDYTGAQSLEVWVWADQPVSFNVRWKEGMTNGGDLENWVSSGDTHPGGSTWVHFVFDIATMSEDDFGDPGCAGSCTSTGNNLMDLQDTNRFEVSIDPGVTNVNMYFDDINFTQAAAPTATITQTWTITNTPVASVPVDYEDFEVGSLASPGTPYGDVGSVITYGVVSTEAYTGTDSLEMNVTSAGWGAGFDFWSNYGSPTINANDAISIEFWIKTDQNIGFTVRVRENGDEGITVDNENWVSPGQNITADPGWQFVSISFGSFGEDDFGNGMCAPNCSAGGSGNNIMELGNLSRFQLQFDAGPIGALVYIDDIKFNVPNGTPTVAPSATFSPVPMDTPTPCVSTAFFFGKNIMGPTPHNFNSGYPDLSHYFAPSSGTAVSMSIYIGSFVDGTLEVMLYADNAGLPGALLASSGDSGTLTADSWNEIPIPAAAITSGQQYWLGFQRSPGSTTYLRKDSTLNAAWTTFTPQTYLYPPNPYPGSGGWDNSEWSIFVNFCL
jgi:hypothetical protein